MTSGKQHLANELITLQLCLQRLTADSWNSGATPRCDEEPIATVLQGSNYETASGVRREKWQRVKRQASMKAAAFSG